MEYAGAVLRIKARYKIIHIFFWIIRINAVQKNTYNLKLIKRNLRIYFMPVFKFPQFLTLIL